MSIVKFCATQNKAFVFKVNNQKSYAALASISENKIMYSCSVDNNCNT